MLLSNSVCAGQGSPRLFNHVISVCVRGEVQCGCCVCAGSCMSSVVLRASARGNKCVCAGVGVEWRNSGVLFLCSSSSVS